MSSLDRNAAARDCHTARLRGQWVVGRPEVAAGPEIVAQRPALTAGQAEEALFGWVYKQPGMPTEADCREIVTRLSDERGQDEARMVMQRFGMKTLRDLDCAWIGIHRPLYDYAATCIFFGVSAGAAWRDTTELRVNMRDRWLLHHEGSNAVWEVRGKLGEELADGTVDDVSGEAEFEKRFALERISPIAVDEL